MNPIPPGLLAVTAIQEAGGHPGTTGQRGASGCAAPAGLPALHQPPAVSSNCPHGGSATAVKPPQGGGKEEVCGCVLFLPNSLSLSCSPKYREGDVTLFALNLSNVTQSLQLPKQLWSKSVDQYLLLPHGKDSILSR